MTTFNLGDASLLEALNTCIDRLNAGATIEDCLRLYPQYADALRILLETGGLIRLSEAPAPEAYGAYQRGRARLLALLDDVGGDQLQPAPIPEQPQALPDETLILPRRIPRQRPGSKLRPLLAAAAAFVLIGAVALLIADRRQRDAFLIGQTETAEADVTPTAPPPTTTPVATATASATATTTFTHTPTATMTITPTVTQTLTPTVTATPTALPTASNTPVPPTLPPPTPVPTLPPPPTAAPAPLLVLTVVPPSPDSNSHGDTSAGHSGSSNSGSGSSNSGSSSGHSGSDGDDDDDDDDDDN